MDIGGDDRGAYALGRYVPSILEEGNYRMAFVANCYRPLTKTPEEALGVMREIELACGLPFTCIINNAKAYHTWRRGGDPGQVEYFSNRAWTLGSAAFGLAIVLAVLSFVVCLSM